MAGMLHFTERQADAILELRLYRLIGLEIEALNREYEQTTANIYRYEDIRDHMGLDLTDPSALKSYIDMRIDLLLP